MGETLREQEDTFQRMAEGIERFGVDVPEEELGRAKQTMLDAFYVEHPMAAAVARRRGDSYQSIAEEISYAHLCELLHYFVPPKRNEVFDRTLRRGVESINCVMGNFFDPEEFTTRSARRDVFLRYTAGAASTVLILGGYFLDDPLAANILMLSGTGVACGIFADLIGHLRGWGRRLDQFSRMATNAEELVRSNPPSDEVS